MNAPLRRPCVALACSLPLLVVACGSGGASGEPTLRMQVAADGAEVAAYEELIEAFHDEHPEIRVELVPVASQGDHMAKLSAEFAAGSPADIFLVNYRRYGQLAHRGAIEPAEPLVTGDGGLDLDDFYEAPLDAFSLDGRLMCVPQNISSLVVYYNRTLFREAGVEEPPAGGWTWTAFLETAKQMTRDLDGDGQTDVYGLAVEPSLPRLAPFVWQAGGEVVDDVDHPRQMTLLDDEAIRAISFFIDLRREHLVAPSLEEAEAEDPEARFARGGVAMILESRRATANLRAAEDLDFDVAPIPHDRTRANLLHSDAYCISSRTKHPEEAATFVRFALGDAGASVLARTGRTVPSRRSIAESEAFLDPTQPPRRARVFLDQVPLLRRLPSIATWNEIEALSEPIVEEWFYGTEPPENLGIEIDLATRHLFSEDAGP